MYRITNTKNYTNSPEELEQATLRALNTLEGKIVAQDAGNLTVKFHKTILGKVLGDRTHFELAIRPNGDGSELEVLGYPLNAIGQELQFGARKGVTQTVLTWLHAHIDHQLTQ